jgi:hypothetical protein
VAGQASLRVEMSEAVAAVVKRPLRVKAVTTVASVGVVRTTPAA